MTKYEIPDDHVWADEKEPETEDRPSVAEVKSHSIEILHRGRARTDGERDIRYRYVLKNGEAIGILRSHRLAESNQFDPMGAAAPYDVPAVVKDTVADFLVIELTEGVENEESPAAQHDRGIALLEKAIRDLSHVQIELEDRREQLQTNQDDA